MSFCIAALMLRELGLALVGKESGFLMILKAFYDASGSTGDLGSSDRPVLTVAGFVSPLNKWVEFVDAWHEEVLGPFEIRRSHMREFAHSLGDFSEWTEMRRREFLVRCVDIIDKFVSYGHATSVDLADYEAVAADLGETQSAFLFASIQTMAGLGKWARKNGLDERTVHIFDAGDGHDGELHLINREMSANGALRELARFDALVFGRPEVPDMVPLQAADMLAYEATKYVRDTKLATDGKGRALRKSAERLLSTGKVDSSYFDEKNLRAYAQHVKNVSGGSA